MADISISQLKAAAAKAIGNQSQVSSSDGLPPITSIQDMLTYYPLYKAHLQQNAPAASLPSNAAPSATTPSSSGDSSTDQVKSLLSQAGAATFGADQVPALLNLVNSESGFNPRAANPTSTARGLFQFLNTTAPEYGLPADASTAPVEAQIQAGLSYIKSRYGTPSNAWAFHLKNNWY